MAKRNRNEERVLDKGDSVRIIGGTLARNDGHYVFTLPKTNRTRIVEFAYYPEQSNPFRVYLKKGKKRVLSYLDLGTFVLEEARDRTSTERDWGRKVMKVFDGIDVG